MITFESIRQCSNEDLHVCASTWNGVACGGESRLAIRLFVNGMNEKSRSRPNRRGAQRIKAGSTTPLWASCSSIPSLGK